MGKTKENRLEWLGCWIDSYHAWLEEVRRNNWTAK